jgi:hypothetical protein
MPLGAGQVNGSVVGHIVGRGFEGSLGGACQVSHSVPRFLANDAHQWVVAHVLGRVVGCLAALLSVVSSLVITSAYVTTRASLGSGQCRP